VHFETHRRCTASTIQRRLLDEKQVGGKGTRSIQRQREVSNTRENIPEANLPMAQLSQEDEPLFAAKVPTPQLVQPVLPSTLANVPAVHDEHRLAPNKPENVPCEQNKQVPDM